MEDLKEFAQDQFDTLTDESISIARLEEIFKFITDYAEDNYLV